MTSAAAAETIGRRSGDDAGEEAVRWSDDGAANFGWANPLPEGPLGTPHAKCTPEVTPREVGTVWL